MAKPHDAMSPITLLFFIVFQHVQIVSIYGHPISMGQITGYVLAVPMILGSWKRRETLIIVCVFTLLAALVALNNQSELDVAGFSLTLFQSSVVLQLFMSGQFARVPPLTQAKIDRTLFIGLCLVVGYSLVQVWSGMRGDFALFAPWGDRQYLYRPILSFGVDGIPRSSGLYLEPSYNAFVIMSLVVAILQSRKFRDVSLILGAVGILATQSVAGIVSFFIIAVLVSFSASKYQTIRLLVLLSVPVITASYVFGRLTSTSDQGSSANYRLIQPLQLLYKTLGEYPLGHALGSIHSTVSSAGLSMQGSQSASSLDNGLYVLVFYFGWIGVALVCALVAWASRCALQILFSSTGDSTYRVGPVWVALSFGFSGAVFSVEFGIFSVLSLAAYFARERIGVRNDFQSLKDL